MNRYRLPHELEGFPLRVTGSDDPGRSGTCALKFPSAFSMTTKYLVTPIAGPSNGYPSASPQP